MKRFDRRAYRATWLVLLTLVVPTVAQAHVGLGDARGVIRGLAHPIGGLDHLVAMIAVGLWAAQRGGRALWMVPATFVVIMALGGAAGAMGLFLPFAEQGIVLSVVALGMLTALAVKFPLVATASVVGVFALFHGHAHGVEVPQHASALAYGAGFLSATALLHGIGIAMALCFSTLGERWLLRVAGGTIALCGAYLCLGL